LFENDRERDREINKLVDCIGCLSASRVPLLITLPQAALPILRTAPIALFDVTTDDRCIAATTFPEQGIFEPCSVVTKLLQLGEYLVLDFHIATDENDVISSSPSPHLIYTMASIRSLFSASRPRLPYTIPQYLPKFHFIATMHTVPKLKDPSLFIEKSYVNGEYVTSKSGATFEVHDPSTGKLIGTCPDMDASDTDLAIAAAEKAFTTFRRTMPRERATMLRKWYNLMTENAEDLATLITWENGKPLADAKGEVAYASGFFNWFSEEAPRIYGDTIPASVPGNRVITIKQPVGVAGLITPWNFPAAMITRKIGPALAAGCTVVAKSPGETPFTANALAELSRRAGIPPGVVNIITSLKNTIAVGEILTTDERIKKVSFTGSTPVGKLLMKQASSTLKKLSFELGGNAPFIVFDDAPDLDAAVAGAVACKFRSSGQTCVCANRIYVQEGIYDEFAAKFAEKVKNFHVGQGFDEGVTHGPVIHSRAVDKVESHVKDAVSKGATIMVGGQRLPDLGDHFYAPTVLSHVTDKMQINTEETFGPVAPLYSFKSEKEVVALANAAPVGLAGYFFSKDVGRIWRVAEALETGMVGVNTGIISDVASPFGGVKESGFGREGSKYGVDEYMTIKSVTLGGMGGELQG
jgi:succinate-semialdehyde dehydrogenase / glutarate-semialdehyde dehydrogenase